MSQLNFYPPSIRDAAIAYVGETPTGERPLTRLLNTGPSALSTAELLAVLFGHKTTLDAQHLLSHFENLTGLVKANLNELCAQHGIGQAKAAQLKAALELGRRSLTLANPFDRPQIRQPADAVQLLEDMRLLEQEQFRLLVLDTKNRVLAIPTIYVGSLNCTHIRVGEVLRYVLRQNCSAVILAHNHPSGDPEPSPEDIIITKKIVEASKMLDITVLDHIIVGHHSFVSLKERNLVFVT